MGVIQIGLAMNQAFWNEFITLFSFYTCLKISIKNKSTPTAQKGSVCNL